MLWKLPEIATLVLMMSLPLSCVSVYQCYLPGAASPPAGLRGDAQSLTARLLGHKGELSQRAASEIAERGRHGNTHHGCPGNQEEEEGEEQRMEIHAVQIKGNLVEVIMSIVHQLQTSHLPARDTAIKV